MRSKYLWTMVTGLVFFNFSGCASYSKVLINHEGQTQNCMVSGGGIFGIAMAENAYSSCVSSLQSAGYVEVQRAGSAGIRFNNESPPRVLKVLIGSPAATAGIKVGDRITEIDGTEVKSKYDADILLFGEKGENKSIRVSRDSNVVLVQISLESISSQNTKAKHAAHSVPDVDCDEIADMVARYECQRSKRTGK